MSETPQEQAEREVRLFDSLKSELKEQASKSIMAFTMVTMPEYRVNWHHDLLGDTLDDFIDGDCDRLIVTMPPRHGKTELATNRLSAYFLGRYPDKKIILGAYSDTLASDMNKEVQRIIETPEYSSIFPDTKLGAIASNGIRYTRNASLFEILGRRGRLKSAGVGSGITGMGADLFIIDDPIKDPKEADSKVYRDRVYKWFQAVASTRLEKGAKVIITITRWHEDDLVGRLTELAESDPNADQYKVLSIPAIKEDYDSPDDPREIGGALWPWKYDEDNLSRKKVTLGSRFWNALYQQRPAALEGSIIKREWLEDFYMERPDNLDQVIQSWDLTFKGGDDNDYVCGQVWGKQGAKRILLDQVRRRMDFPETLNAIRALSMKWPEAQIKIIEDKANGPAVISSLQNELTGIIPYLPDRSKEGRVFAVSPLFEAGNVVLPDPRIAPWVRDYIDELTSFPFAVNDDQVDATSQALLRFQNESVGQWTSKMKERGGTIAGALGGGDEW